MNRKQIKKIVANPRHIPGIHNYCDRWCERCTKTLRCSIYAVESADRSGPRSRDPENEAFWKRLREIFVLTMEMVQAYAKKNGIPLNKTMTQEEIDAENQVDLQTDDHPLVTAGMTYLQKVRHWFDSNEELLRRMTEQFESRLEMELPADNPEAEWRDLHNAIEVVQWYFAFIAVKLRRAVHQLLLPPEPDEGETTDIPSDSDGSAKIALIGIDRSIEAWAIILKSLPEQEKEILDFLVHLESLRKQAEQTFPNARAFIRPGFDEPSHNRR